MDITPTHCTFETPAFTALGTLVFRLTVSDHVAAMAVRIDALDVVVPLRAVAQLMDIRAGSPDARMLDLIERSLCFVKELKLGDGLPSEVVTGEASWKPSTCHLQLALAKVQLELVRWIGGLAGSDESRITSQMLVVSADDPAIRPRVQEALRQAAAELGVAGGGPAVAALVESLAAELSYIEALRERLLERVRAMVKCLMRVGQETTALAPSRRETLFQVIRLGTSAVGQIVARFEEVDAQSCEILPALRNLDQQRSYLRAHRDTLYSMLVTWSPLLKAWDGAPTMLQKETEDIWRVIDESYRFLAPRYMVVQQWQTIMTAPDTIDRNKTALVW